MNERINTIFQLKSVCLSGFNRYRSCWNTDGFSFKCTN